MKSSVLTSALAVGALLAFAAQSPAAADPTITEAFLANVKPNVAFLEQSSQLALVRSKGAAHEAMRAYAQGELTDAMTTAVALDDSQAVRVASIVPANNQDVSMGRSVAIAPASGLGQAANGRSPMGPKDVDGLTRLSGRAFFDAFWLKQVDALSQLRADYEDYAQNGDDAALVAMAKRRLPDVEHRLALLSKL